MRYYILTLDQKKEWNNYLRSLPSDQQDVYYLPEYYELYQNKVNGRAMCFIFEDGGDLAIYPFLINSINDLGYNLPNEYYDIQGVYGYNGVATSNYSIIFKNKFQNAFNEFCTNTNIIAEFTRFNPVIENNRFSTYLSPLKTNKNIIVDLNCSENNTWKNKYHSSVRKNVNNAIRNGLCVRIFEGKKIPKSWLKKFINIYYSTLKRSSADKFYYFNSEYFTNIKTYLGNNTLFFFTVLNDVAISCELVTYNSLNAYSFIGGTLKEYYSYRPNDLLKHEIIKYLRKNGMKNYCLGGGIIENDGIHRYKKSFFKNGEVNFYIGTKIYNKNIYHYLCKNWSKNNTGISEKYSNILLKYRITE